MPLPREIEYNGRIYSLRQLAEAHDLSYATLRSRLNGGWSVDKAVNTPVAQNAQRKWLYRGKLYTAAELAAMHGHLSTPAMLQRLKHGMSPEQAVVEPLTKGGKFIKRKDVEAPEPEKTHWIPHNSPADYKKCRKCRYSERDSSSTVICMFLALHEPPERRGCEPGKNCTRFKAKNRKTEEKKLAKWKGAINA